MKKFVLIGALAFAHLTGYSQVNQNHCGTDEHYADQVKSSPDLKAAKELFDADFRKFMATYNPNDYKTKQGLGKSSAPKYIIPVVVHVLHANGSENISDAQIQSEIDFLNKSFRNLNNDTINRRAGWFVTSNGDSNWYDYKSLAADAEVEFRLAKKDPQGNCTNGIVRVYTPLTNKGNDDLKKISVWDTKRYFNMWVVRNINKGNTIGIAGYAQFPFGVGGGASTDGVMIISNEFGNIGTSQPGQTPNVTTVTHESGHWLGLYHPFQITTDSCGLDGDGVMDTPPTYFSPTSTEPLRNKCNNKSFNTCSTDKPDYPDMQEAFMDYFIGNCASNMFTLEQKARMHYVLDNIRKNLWSQENLVATGVIDGPTSCNPIAAFNTATPVTCAGNKITFYDFSYNSSIKTWEWTFEGGTPATSINKAPGQIQYGAPGKYDVTLKVTDQAGNTSTTTMPDYITIQPANAENPGGYYTCDWWYENNWEKNGWTFVYENPKNVFSRVSGVSYANYNCMRLSQDPYNSKSSVGALYSLVSPSFNFTNSNNPYFEFQYAFAQATLPASVGGGNTPEELKVYTSIDCGKTWVQREYITSTNISTIGSGTAGVLSSSIDFVPADRSKWKQVRISGSKIPVDPNVKFKIEFKYAGGNNFYLDNVMLGLTTGVNENLASTIGFSAQPNPFSSATNLNYELKSNETVTVKVFDITGKEIATVFSGEQKAGQQSVTISKSELGLQAGIYLVEMTVGGSRLSQKIVVE